jgi:hypothetical protein
MLLSPQGVAAQIAGDLTALGGRLKRRNKS